MVIEIKGRIMKGKNLIYLVITLLATTFFGSCSEDYMQYDQNLSSIRFVYNKGGEDSLTYSFALHPGVTEDVVSIPLQIIGMTAPEAREVKVLVDSKHTTAKEDVNFTIPKCEIEANSVSGNMKVIVKKSADLETRDVVIALNLAANENFVEAPINQSSFRIVLTGRMTKPSDWPFGDYSRVKHEFVIKVTNKGTNYKEWSQQELIYYTGELNKALYEYNSQHPGEPLTDENGLLVTF